VTINVINVVTEMNTSQMAIIEHEEEESPHERVTINVINVVTEMNTSQMAIQQEQSLHNYKLRQRLT